MKLRLLITAALFAIYRLGIHIGVPGVDRAAWAEIVQRSDSALREVLNLLSGGGFQQLSICALGLAPFLVGEAIATFGSREPADQSKAKRRRRVARWIALLIGTLGGFLLAILLEHYHVTYPKLSLVAEPGWHFRLVTVAFIVAGTVLVTGIAEEINKRGLGSGVSILMAANVLSAVPLSVDQILEQSADSALPFLPPLLAALVVLVMIMFLVFCDGAFRYVSVRHEQVRVADRAFGGQSSTLPFKLVFDDFLPVVLALFSVALISLIVGFFDTWEPFQMLNGTLAAGAWGHVVIFTALTISFTALSTAVQTDPERMADDLRTAGAVLEAVEREPVPGTAKYETATYIDKLLLRLTTISAFSLATISVIPFVIQRALNVSLTLGGVSLIVVVITALRTRDQLERPNSS